MAIKLSHSAKEKYLRCPMAYHMHYNLGIREKQLSSALVFGSAMDEGLNVMLAGGTIEDSLETFHYEFTLLVNEGNVKFSKADTADFEPGLEASSCLRKKGDMLLRTYYKEIMPQFKECIGIQKQLRLSNKDYDLLTGAIDFVAKMNDGRTILFDNKTSAVKYKDDKIRTEVTQLALYNYILKEHNYISKEYNHIIKDVKCEHIPKIDAVGYIVLEKKIRKNEPRVRINMVIDTISKEMEERTVTEINSVLQGVRMGRFHSNHPACSDWRGQCICVDFVESGGTNLGGIKYGSIS